MISALWSHSYLLHAWLAGLALTAICGPLGCFVVWRRMAYFGDTMAHAALLGVALGLAATVPVPAAVFAVAAALAVLTVIGTRGGRLEDDTMLGILAHGMLGLSLVIIALSVPTRVDLMRYLFGDLLALSREDVVLLAGLCALLLAVMAVCWRRLILVTLHEDVAAVEGLHPQRLRLLLLLLLAALVAVAIQLVGALLITALLIIPAAAARGFSTGPARMAAIASLIGMAAVTFGLGWAYYADLPAAPAIVTLALATFAASWVWQRL